MDENIKKLAKEAIHLRDIYIVKIWMLMCSTLCLVYLVVPLLVGEGSLGLGDYLLGCIWIAFCFAVAMMLNRAYSKRFEKLMEVQRSLFLTVDKIRIICAIFILPSIFVGVISLGGASTSKPVSLTLLAPLLGLFGIMILVEEGIFRLSIYITYCKQLQKKIYENTKTPISNHIEARSKRIED
jgi:hypothetical protein